MRCDINTIGDLTEVDQAFIDAVFQHNGADPPRPLAPIEARPVMMESGITGQAMARLSAMVHALDPDCAYDDWLHGLAGIHHESAGSEDGFALANTWSSRGQKYCGEAELRSKWRSFEGYAGRPVTVGTIIAMLNRQGSIGWRSARQPSRTSSPASIKSSFFRSGLNRPQSQLHRACWHATRCSGTSQWWRPSLREQVPVIGELALSGQVTTFLVRPIVQRR